MQNYTKPERISLKNHPDYSENWVQDIIANDPSILGLGDLVLRDRERVQQRAGRLDLLLQDPETYKRYEVELQLGATDETHIIRTIEYYDIEKKRYPQYEHCAVLIAEDITSRFLNVVSLFNGSLPIIAIQMQAFKIGDHVTVVFTKVLDEYARGLVDEDEDAISAPTDRAYWENEKGTKKTVAIADELMIWIKEIDGTLELKYNKFYIGLSKNGQAFNFVAFRPKKSFMSFDLKIPMSDEIDNLIENAGLDMQDYNTRWGNYRLRLTSNDLKTHKELLSNLIKMAYQNRIN